MGFLDSMGWSGLVPTSGPPSARENLVKQELIPLT